MSAENIAKRCKNCTFGERSGGGMFNIPVEARIPVSILVTPTIKRNCLNPLENIKDLLLSKIEDAIDHDIPIERDERIVTISAKCVKPDSYSPRE